MDEVQDQIETLIDDIERDSSITKAEILLTLYKLKEKIEDYNLGKEEIIRRGLKGREWLLSEEAKMTAAHMGQNFIDNINILFKNWEPVDKFTIDKVEDKKSTYNPNAVQYTPEFKQKLKEVLS